MKIRVLLLNCVLLLMLDQPPLLADEGGGEDLDSLVSEALERNPEIHGSEAQWRMLLEKVKRSGTWEDPMLMVGIQNAMVSAPLSFDSDPATAKVIGISQMVPFFGKTDLMRAGVVQEAEAARWNLEERKVELRQMVSETWAQLAYVGTSLELIEKNLLLLDDISRLAEASYASGMGTQADILRVQIERSRMEEMKYGLQQQQSSLQAGMSALLRQENPVAISIPAGAIAPVSLSAAELYDLALKSRPALFAGAARIGKAEAGERLAKRDYYPDFTLALEYMQRDPFTSGMAASDGGDMYSATLSFNLPVLTGKRRAMVAESEQERLMAEADIEMLKNEIRRRIGDLGAKLVASARMAALYRDGLLPQEELASESTLAAFRAGKVEFMAVLDSQMKLLADQQKQAMFVAEHQMLRAQLEATVGTRIK